VTPCRIQPRRSSSPSTTSASTRSQPSIFRPRISKRRTCGSLISDSASAGSKALAAVVSAQLAEELPDVADEQVGGLHGGEVAAAVEL
jgi:hypothetical protein